MQEEHNVSGRIFAKKCSLAREGEEYVIRSKDGAGWGLPVNNVEPNDLRVLADRIEAARAKTQQQHGLGSAITK